MAGSAVLRYGVAALVLAGLGAGGWYGWAAWSANKSAPQYRMAKVERGAITASVSATGTLNPVRSVQVGSQVSGQIKEMYVDFNDAVTPGQMLARIDPESFELRVRQAQADVEASRATVATQQAAVGAQRAAVSREEVNLAEARRDLERKQALFDKGFISGVERDRAAALVNTTQEQLKTTRAQLAVSEAQAKNAEAVVKQREAQLSQAQVDLERTAIRAPGEGVIIRRSVDAGQTVAASLQAPELFIIARNLTDMQVEASIDEAEVGRLRLGQRATFTVDSFPGRIFSGEVLQVRKSARVVQNVVTYIAVIGAANPDQALLPGMTANVRIITDQRDRVLKVPNAALRFRPPGWVDAPSKGGAGKGPGPAVAEGDTEGAAPAAREDAPAAKADKGGAGDTAPKREPRASKNARGDAGKDGGAAAYRRRLVEELKLDAGQQEKLDGFLAEQRKLAAAARDLPDGERRAALAKNRAELRAQVSGILKPEQKGRFGEIMAELADRARAAKGGEVSAGRAEGAKAASKSAPREETKQIGKASRQAGKDGETAAGKGGQRAGQAATAQAFRDRLVSELKMDAEQVARLDQVFASPRSAPPQAVRGLKGPDRIQAAERARAELRMQIYEILKPEQRTRYGEILTELAGRQVVRGRVFVLDDSGQPRPVAVRLGLTDGAMTEVLGGDLQEGQTVLTGAVGAAGAPARAGAGGAGKGPPMPVTP